jgi:hypothetical protein
MDRRRRQHGLREMLTALSLEDTHPPTRPVAFPAAREMAGVKPRELLAEVGALSFG